MVDDDLVIGGEGGRVADVVAASDKREIGGRIVIDNSMSILLCNLQAHKGVSMNPKSA